MREFFSSIVLFLALAVVFSQTGCSSSVESGNQPVAGAPAEAPKKKSEYPALVTAAADAEIKNLDGTTFKVTDKKGKVVLLNLWATWCGPCRAEMPTLVRMQDKHRDAGLEIIGLNTDDETVDDINAFVAEMKLNYTIAWADTKLQAALVNITKFPGIPQSFLIDRDGNLRGIFKGANRAEVAKMEELIELVVTGQPTPTNLEAGDVPTNPTQNENAPASGENSPADKGKAGSKEKK